MTGEAIYDQICKHTCEAFGFSISPHLFRDCAVTTIATRDPKHAGIASDLLGHADLRTTERYYNQASQIEAGRTHQSALMTMRRQLAQQMDTTRAGGVT